MCSQEPVAVEPVGGLIHPPAFDTYLTVNCLAEYGLCCVPAYVSAVAQSFLSSELPPRIFVCRYFVRGSLCQGARLAPAGPPKDRILIC